jgi:hypothetical protein
MKQWYYHSDKIYIVHKKIAISSFTNSDGILNMDMVKEGRDSLFNVDHVLKTDRHFLFVETIQDAEIIEENQDVVEEAHS